MLEKIYKEHHSTILDYAVKKYGDTGKDYLQNVYLKLINYSDQKLKEIDKKGYLLYLLHNMLNQQHVNKVRKTKPINKYELLLSKENTFYDYEIDRKNLTFAQEIFIEYYEKGYTVSKISKLFGISHRTITNELRKIKCKKSETI